MFNQQFRKTKKVFNKIYRNDIWGNGSGPGSRIENCKEYINFLQIFIQTNNIGTILDIGVGDGQVLSALEIDEVEYTGLDVSNKALALAKQRNNRPNIKFINKDISTYNFGKVDLVICKDVLQHLPNETVLIVLRKIINHSKYAIVVNDISPQEELLNTDIQIGGYRPIHIGKAPFSASGEELFTFDSVGFVKSVYLIKS